MKEIREVLQNKVGKITIYKEWKACANQNQGIGQFINADHQPPVSSILAARKSNQNSKLPQAMHEVATNASPLNTNLISDMGKYHGLNLPIVYVPAKVHCEFPSTKSPNLLNSLATAISRGDVVGTFKLTILGAMPRFMLCSTFQNNQQSKTRLQSFKNSFQQHSKMMVQEWFKPLQAKGVMETDNLTTLIAWINTKGYNNQNDPYRNQFSTRL